MFGGTVRLNPVGVTILFAITGLAILFYVKSGGRDKSGEQVDLKKILAVCIELTESAGRVVHEIRKSSDGIKEKSKGKTLEGANDPVTNGDTQSHLAIFKGLKKAFPGIRIISEEHNVSMTSEEVDTPLGDTSVLEELAEGIKVPMKDVTVWLDPLDATQEFTENLLQYVTIMLCVVVKSEPVIGVIHQPFEGRTVWAWLGHGLSKNLNIAEPQKPGHKERVIVSRSHSGQVKDLAAKAFGAKAEIVLAGGAGYKVLQVLQGESDVYIHSTMIKKWDICAGHALMTESDGKMTTLSGEQIQFGPDDDPVNDKGLLVSLYDHARYVESVQAAGGTDSTTNKVEAEVKQ